MFYFLAPSLYSFDIVLILAAVLPAIFLMVKVYRSDRLEAESPLMLRRLAVMGVLSSLLALVEERVLVGLLDALVTDNEQLYLVLLFFGIVAYAEESSKYLFLKHNTWNSPEFNCQYDGVVYAVFVSLGFALWENISYVLHYGFSTAVVRALTAIPGHACFGVFMGAIYGAAKRFERRGDPQKAKLLRVLSVVIAALLHGAYDYIATTHTSRYGFIAFIALLFAVSYVLVGRMSKYDQYI